MGGTNAPISDLNKLLFIHVPKAGGSTVENSFLFDDRRRALGGKKYLGGHRKLIAFPFDAPECDGYHSFAMVRHPCKRLLSLWAYYSQDLGNPGDQAWVHSHLSPHALTNASEFVKSFEFAQTQSGTGLTRGNGEEKYWNPGLHMHTWPMVAQLLDRSQRQIGVNQVLVMERWNESVNALSDAVNGARSRVGATSRATSTLDRRPLSSVARLAGRGEVDVKGALLTARPLLASHHGSRCDLSFDDDAWRVLLRLYAVDFCAFGFEQVLRRADGSPPPRLQDLTPEKINSRLKKCGLLGRDGPGAWLPSTGFRPRYS